MSYLGKVSEFEDHGRDIENLDRILRALTNSSAPFINSDTRIVSKINTTTLLDPGIYKNLERAASFLAALRAAGPAVEVDQERLSNAIRVLLKPLEDRVCQRDLYTYTPLQKGTKFRVLRLISCPGEILRCSIEEVNIGEVQYEALSYEWGNPEQYF